MLIGARLIHMVTPRMMQVIVGAMPILIGSGMISGLLKH